MRVLVAALLLLWPASAAGQPLAEAQSLYQEARFEEALELLRSLPEGIERADVPRWAELRVLVLFALRSDDVGDALMDLALLAPDHELPPGLPPQIHTAFQMACAHLEDPAEANLARARAQYYVADFSGALAVLSTMHVPTLTRQQRIERMVLRSLALFALNRRAACRRQLSELARLDPDHRFNRRVPPELRALWDEVRGGGRSNWG